MRAARAYTQMGRALNGVKALTHRSKKRVGRH
jgi:hypothetical protein